jgi:hypothetical protein
METRKKKQSNSIIEESLISRISNIEGYRASVESFQSQRQRETSKVETIARIE